MRLIIKSVCVILIFIFFNCTQPIEDNNNDDTNEQQKDNENPRVIDIFPQSSSSDVKVDSIITISFNETLNSSIYGNVIFTNPSLTLANGNNSDITIEGNKVTIDYNSTFTAGQTYTGIEVTGFKDLAGNLMTKYTNAAYSFTIETSGVKPEAQNVIVDGTVMEDMTLSGMYDYYDGDGDTEGATTFRWLISDTVDGSFAAITDETSETYALKASDVNKYIKFEVTPVSTIEPYTGDPVLSSARGPVIVVDNIPPEVNDITSPSNSSTSVDVTSNIIFSFDEALKTNMFGTVAFTNPSITFTNGNNCSITISGTTVTVNPDSNFDFGTTYTGITITGFEDLAGNSMTGYTDAEYFFTTRLLRPSAEITNNTHETLLLSKNVTLSSTDGASIYYTLDGSEPTVGSGILYDGQFKLYYSSTLKARAFKDGNDPSEILTQEVDVSINLTNNVTDWREEIIYFMLTDRFNDGDSSNNQQMDSGADHIPGDGKTYQGGDFQGVIDKLDYLEELGVTAIWITSPVVQAWENANYTSYHGYWAQNFMDVDPHLGTIEEMRKMVYEAHKRGIKVIMDVVVNHTGSLFKYPGASPDEWEPDFNSSGYTIEWLEDLTDNSWVIDSNRVKPLPIEFQNPDWFYRMGGNATTMGASDDERTKGDFAGLRDVNTGRQEVRDKLKEIFKWWIKQTNIDGYRIDTVKHVETDFWTEFCGDIRTFAASPEGGNKNFYMVAEVYDGSVEGLGAYTHSQMLDSVLGFNMRQAVFAWNDPSEDQNTVFRDTGSWDSRMRTNIFEGILANTESNLNLGDNSLHTNGDGLTARQKIGYFIDNHDLNRFMYSNEDAANLAPAAGEITNFQMALKWLLTWEGIPVIYYATEQNYKQSLFLTNSGEHGDGAGNVNKGNRPNLWQVQHSAQGNQPFNTTHDTFKLISGLNELRKTYPELAKGFVNIYWSDNDGAGQDKGILAYTRGSGATDEISDDILIVLNTHYADAGSPSTGSGNDMGTPWPVDTVLETIQIPGYDTAQPTVWNGTADVTEVTTFAQTDKTSAVWFEVPANSIRLFRVKP